jgi:hypothetical protein
VFYERNVKRYDIWSTLGEYTPRFRADNGFIVQNGFRRAGLWMGYHFYPQSSLSYVRPYTGLEWDGSYDEKTTIRTGVWQGVEFQGKWASNGWIAAGNQAERVGGRMLPRTALEWNVSAAPWRWFPAVRFDGVAGEKIDYAGARVGRGATLNLGGTIRASDHLEFQLTTTREWLDLEEGRLFDASIDWLKMTYTFSARTLVRLIAQQNDVEHAAKPHDRSLSFSGLYAYKLNWQTVFFVGFGDSRISGIQQPRSVFMKVAYALQR